VWSWLHLYLPVPTSHVFLENNPSTSSDVAKPLVEGLGGAALDSSQRVAYHHLLLLISEGAHPAASPPSRHAQQEVACREPSRAVAVGEQVLVRHASLAVGVGVGDWSGGRDENE
jgi:hypothetical protein